MTSDLSTSAAAFKVYAKSVSVHRTDTRTQTLRHLDAAQLLHGTAWVPRKQTRIAVFPRAPRASFKTCQPPGRKKTD